MANLTKIHWWQWFPLFGWRVVAIVDSADNIPERLPRNGVVIVGSLTKPKWIAFDCPCRGGHRIMLNADKSRRPCWTVLAKRSLTIIPSVDYDASEQRCHYYVRSGRISWVHRVRQRK